ncbi:MAG: PorT family protein [Chitinophagaceae bacterium]|nr:PorT family protein [Chitinophagaceae bacterium]
MKKLIIVPLMILSMGVFAQKFQFGLKAGANISNFTGLKWENVDTKARVGFHGGAFLNFLLGDNFMISPEVLFSSQGAKLESAGHSENFDVSYLAIPVMLRYRFTGGFYLEAGPQFSFKLNENVPDQSVENFAKSSDVGIGMGLGYHGNGGLGIGARYIAGISKVGDFDETQLANPDFKNGVIQVSLFYTLFNNHRDDNKH